MFSYQYINVIFIEFIYIICYKIILVYKCYFFIISGCNKIMYSANIKSILYIYKVLVLCIFLSIYKCYFYKIYILDIQYYITIYISFEYRFQNK